MPRLSSQGVEGGQAEISKHFGCHAFKFCTKFERNRMNNGEIIDDLARFRRAISGVGYFYRAFSGVRGPNFTKLGADTGRPFLHRKVVSEF